MKRLFIYLFILTTFFVNSYLSGYAMVFDSEDFQYKFYLYYDQGKLTNDRDQKLVYDIIASKFIPQTRSGTSYKGVVYSIKGDELEQFYFDPKAGNTQLTKGKVQVLAPYFASAKEIVLFDTQGLKAHSVDVSGSSFCDEDGLCEDSFGEDFKNCPTDCKGGALPTIVPSVSVNPVSGSSDGGIPTVQWMIYSAIGLVVLAVGLRVWVWWRRYRGINQASMSSENSPPKQ